MSWSDTEGLGKPSIDVSWVKQTFNEEWMQPMTSSREATGAGGCVVDVVELQSERDRCFRVSADCGGAVRRFTFKVCNVLETRDVLEMQLEMMERCHRDPTCGVPRPVPRASVAGGAHEPGSPGACIVLRMDAKGREVMAWCAEWVEGKPLSSVGYSTRRSRQLGRMLGRMDRALEGFNHRAGKRDLEWDLARNAIDKYLHDVTDERRRELLEFTRARVSALLDRGGWKAEVDFAFDGDGSSGSGGGLRRALVHNDANDNNVIVDDTRHANVASIIDFGDSVWTPLVHNVAIAVAYAMLSTNEGGGDFFEIARTLLRAYHLEHPLREAEACLVLPLALLRVCTTCVMAAHSVRLDPDNEYLRISEEPAWRLLAAARARFGDVACDGGDCDGGGYGDAAAMLASECGVEMPLRCISRLRNAHIGPNLSISYSTSESGPLHIVSGSGARLIASDGTVYVDCVNNVSHCGHTHPHVVQAEREQCGKLCTNTRYHYSLLAAYSERLARTFPDPLSVVYLVNSGSEANELAMRLARAATGGTDFIALEHGYVRGCHFHAHVSASRRRRRNLSVLSSPR